MRTPVGFRRFELHGGNADVVRQELERERGVMVSLRTVERAVQERRRRLRAEPVATVRFETFWPAAYSARRSGRGKDA